MTHREHSSRPMRLRPRPPVQSTAYATDMNQSPAQNNVQHSNQAVQSSFSFQTLSHDRKRAVKAIITWVVFTLAGWVSLPSWLQLVPGHTAWTVFTHCIGLSIFLLIVTQQTRWIPISAVGGIAFLLLGHFTGTPDDWITYVSHAFGFMMLVVMAVMVLGLCGGMLYVWTELIHFVKRLVRMYPKAYQDMKAHPVLEKVDVSFPDRRPSGNSLHESNVLIQTPANLLHHSHSSGNTQGDTATENEDHFYYADSDAVDAPTVLFDHAEGPSCNFCKDPNIRHYLPVCGEWSRRLESGARSMCSPYTTLSVLNKQYQLRVSELSQANDKLRESAASLQGEVERLQALVTQQSNQITSMQNIHRSEIAQKTRELADSETQRQRQIAELIRQLNQQAKNGKEAARMSAAFPRENSSSGFVDWDTNGQGLDGPNTA